MKVDFYLGSCSGMNPFVMNSCSRMSPTLILSEGTACSIDEIKCCADVPHRSSGIMYSPFLIFLYVFLTVSV